MSEEETLPFAGQSHFLESEQVVSPSTFFDDLVSALQVCKNPEHCNAPEGTVIHPGQVWKNVCPACRNVLYIRGSDRE